MERGARVVLLLGGQSDVPGPLCSLRPMFPEPDVPGAVYSRSCILTELYIPGALCSRSPMFPEPYVPGAVILAVCLWSGHFVFMWPWIRGRLGGAGNTCSVVTVGSVRCSRTSMFPEPDVPGARCSRSCIFPEPYVPGARCSRCPMFP